MAPFFSPDVKYKNAPEGDKDAEAELIIPRFPREALRRCAGLGRAVRGLAAIAGVLVAFQALAADPGQPPDWILASSDARAVAGQPFEVLLVSLGAEPPPDEINVRLKGDVDERILRMQALGPARGTQRRPERLHAQDALVDIALQPDVDLVWRRFCAEAHQQDLEGLAGDRARVG